MSYTSQPDIMAIGDSMYQGVRSLSITRDLIQHSPPAQVAEAGGWSMLLPDPPADVLFDLEALLRRGELLDAVGALQKSAAANLQHWPLDGTPWSQNEAFDNVAFGGAAIASLTTETYASNIAKVRQLVALLSGPVLPRAQLLDTIGQLWYSLSICFTLNPRHRPEQAGKTALDQVADRAPSILLINIGSNEGLFRAGFVGDVSDASFASIGKIPGLVHTLAQRLATLPERVERIVYNAVLRPRFVPNLMPDPFDHSLPGDQYFSAYGNRIGSTQTVINGTRLQQFDAAVQKANVQSRDILEHTVGGRLIWNDLYSIADQYDGKHWSGRGVPVTLPNGGRRTLVNKPIEPTLFGLQSGFSGLDNMHPSVPGYAIIADSVLAALGRSERTDKDRAFRRDTLLTNLPGPLVLSQAELSLVPLSGVMGG
jgi:hypothetical protein